MVIQGMINCRYTYQIFVARSAANLLPVKTAVNHKKGLLLKHRK